jgi:Undecaprenyl-phosphate glucose phosphotransferase
MRAVTYRASSAASEAGVSARFGLPEPESRWSARVVMDLVALADVVALAAAAALTAIWHNALAIEPSGSTIARFEFCLIVVGVTHFLMRQRGEYATTRACVVVVKPIALSVLLAVTIAAVFSVAVALGSPERWPLSWLPIWWSLAVAFLAVERWMAAAFVARLRARGAFDTNLAVYGSGRIAQRVADFARAPGSGTHLIGIYDDRASPERAEPDAPATQGGLEQLIEAGRLDRIDEIIVALPPAADGRLAEIVRRLEHLPVRLRICTHLASDFLDADIARHAVSALGPVGLLDVKSKPMADWAPVMKRIQDYAIAAPALLLLTPLLIVIAIAIKLDSPGPVFFRQRRHGLNHRVFQVLKFRSMRVAEDGAQVRQATKNDPRVTRVGAFLRKTSLDELPQLINIVAGDMALVGPRPHALVHNEHYGEILERYANRHQVKPGLTGWAQINGFRGETLTPDAMRARVEHDLWYIDNWSLLLDLKIIALTPLYGFTNKNAY